MRAALARLALIFELAAGLSLVAIAGRFALSAVAFAVEQRSPKDQTAAASTASTSGASKPPGARKKASQRPAPAVSAARGKTKPPSAKAGTPLRLSLMVSVGPPRSEVYVDSIKVGNSPYLGVWSCRAGEGIHIDVMPPTGAPMSFERRCVPGATIRVAEEPPQ